MSTADRIKSRRTSLGMTQAELANKVGLQHPAIYKYEAGLVVNLKQEMIGKLSSALNCSPSWLMCMDEDSEIQVDAMEDFEAAFNMQIRIERIKRASESDLKVIDLILEKYAQPVDDGVETDTREAVIDIVEAGKKTLPVAARGGITSASTDALNKLSNAAKKTDKVF